MTEKEKAKAYDEAIERAKKWHNISNPIYCNIITEKIFPELKESEDEEIRKEIISILRNAYWTSNRNRFNKLVAWLERQGLKPFKNEDVHKFMEYIEKEAKAYDFNLPNRSYDIYAFAKDLLVWLEKQGKTPTDKIEPRFNVGDWVVFITSGNSGNLYQVEKKENYEYTLRNIHGGSFCVSFFNEELIREWTIQDAKDGDVLCCKSGWTCIFKAVDNRTNTFSSYCFMDSNKNFFSNGSESHTLDKNSIKVYKNGKIHPATKKQRDNLMKAMNDAGYEWDAEKKELKKKNKISKNTNWDD